MSQVSEGSGELTSPISSQRSMRSSQDIADGRPVVTISKMTRSKSSLTRKKSKSVSPHQTLDTSNSDANEEALLILNTSSGFDLRSFFSRAKSTPQLFRQATASSSDACGGRRLRGLEELCLLMPRQSGKNSNPRKAWFMTPGLIGRDSGENVVIATKDTSMDPVHAEISVDGDDYILKDLNSSTGTFLCLSTTNRHHPQRDGYRLRVGDTIMLGFGSKIYIEELETVVKPPELTIAGKRRSLEAKLDRRLTDQLALERSAMQVLHGKGSKGMIRMPSFSTNGPKKSVRFAEILDVAKTDPEAEPMLPTEDGTDFPIGSRYKRKTKRPSEPIYRELAPVTLKVAWTTPEQPTERTALSLPPKTAYTIGSSPWCDIQVVSEGIYAVHARIVFDGHFFVLQDLSFEENPRRKTRVLLTRATRIGRGDWLLMGKCAVNVVSVYRAFREHEPDLKEIAFRCHLLRPSKRKSRRRESYLPVGFKHALTEPFVIGKGNLCDGQVFTAALSVKQFLVQLDHGQCSITPRFAGINQGMYFLLGRNSIAHETKFKDDLVQYTSKALMLVEGSIFKIGSAELEVTFVKLEDSVEAATRMEEIRENTEILKTMPWLQQITFDRHSMENVARRAQRLELEAGDSIYDEGDPASFLFVVLEGEIELTSFPKSSNRRISLSYGASSRPGSSNSMSSLISSASGKASPAGEVECLVETVCSGSYFGEASLRGGEMDYAESAKALTACLLLVLSREDVCGYFSYYMDIIRPHLSYESHKDLLQKMRLCVPFCSSISYQELRIVASKAERIYYQQDDWIIRNGEFLHKKKRRFGVLLLRYGAVDVVTADGKPIFVPTSRAKTPFAEMGTADDVSEHHDEDQAEGVPPDEEIRAAEKSGDSESGGSAPASAAPTKPAEERQSWGLDAPLFVLPHDPTIFHNLKARTGVQCFYIDMSAFQHLMTDHETRTDTERHLTIKKTTAAPMPPPPMLRRRSTNRRSSYSVQFKARHSQVFTSALRSNGIDDNDNLIENADLEDGNDPSRKWRRKKRNRTLLEKTIAETQQNSELLNALVLYVLSGANRGDIHVVRNVATIGGIISGADIELNDQYVSSQQAVIEHREGRYWLYDTFSEWGTYVRLEENQTVQVYPGDVFLAGEVEFTCMGTFPERRKTSLCCIQ